MLFCTKCGAVASATSRFCGSCGNPIGTADAPNPSLPAPAAHGPIYAPASQGQPVIIVKSGKSAGVAAVLSFFWCGLGQIYNGQIGKGLLMMLVYFFSVLAIFIIIGFITTPILWIFGMYDAYSTAERINREAGLG